MLIAPAKSILIWFSLMPRDPYLHELKEFPELIRIIAEEKAITPQLIEKDYWIMHCLYGLTQQGFDFELKGGTSLSKGYGIINRFSEDVDIRINPAKAPFEVFIGKNKTKKKYIESRGQFYDWVATEISIDGINSVERDKPFDDERLRSGGIRLFYNPAFDNLNGLKEGILLELGFDDTTPNQAITISSWAYDKAINSPVTISNNQAIDIKCYHPGYTFVEKLQTVSTKFRKQQESGSLPTNFLRHYYDLSQLIDHPDVQRYIGTDDYHERKGVRFRQGDNQNLAENEAFILSDDETRNTYTREFENTSDLYYKEQPDFESILLKIQSYITEL